MKNFMIALLCLTFLSCNENDSETVNFAGTYEGILDCSGPLESEDFQIIIVSTGENTYTVDFGDDVIFNATQADDILTIPEQTLNADLGFDVVTMSGIMTKLEPEFTFRLSIEHQVDSEGISNCDNTLTRIR